MGYLLIFKNTHSALSEHTLFKIEDMPILHQTGIRELQTLKMGEKRAVALN